ncbi:large subunit GTPase 1 homolog [Amyelois transitella]|uniref:large subunit GTPase 1 homolog n=1 Tax=Amyelois transitella TaxID=680683 RepID=UPI0029901C1B|nr:large subunit GTPase 1 homolog [Amyelois transitella]XP_013192788.2 large subunit GTPase 1 homolog [Amyelois transitella]
MGKKNKESLGRSLIKDRFSKNRHKKHVEDNTMLHTTEINDGYDWGRLNLQSVTAESSLQEFLSTAELAQREFTAEKLNLKYVKSVPSEVQVVTSQPDFDEPLTVPRRPAWNPSITAEEQLNRERESFLEWRRHLNELQAKLGAALTPYERNLEFWRQLWRTLEKSDIVLILLDARNPLLFRCEDLEKYAIEQKCKFILLLNKADLTTEYVRKCWAEYFNKQNIPIIFFSAAKQTNERKISETSSKSKEELNSDTESAVSDIDEDDLENETLKSMEDDIELFKKQLGDIGQAVSNTADKLDRIQIALDKVVENLRSGKPIEPLHSEEIVQNEVGSTNDVINSHEIYDRNKLLEVLKAQKLESLKNPPRISVGMIGYPNVGKSSTVNVLMQTKKVSVSAMPGHTRHIQSLVLDEQLELLDCPGLVLPAYAVAPDLMLTAVLSIDQMRSHDAAMARLCQLVSKHTFECKYGLLLPDNEDSQASYKQILTAHAFNRGFMTAAGQPDQSRSARILLKEAASGKLRWEQPPPGCEAKLEDLIEEKRSEKRKPTPREARMVEGWLNKSAEIDSAFFAMKKSTSHVKGKPVLGVVGAQLADGQTGKPWKLEKKHANKNKREKLRRVYAHLDEH